QSRQTPQLPQLSSSLLAKYSPSEESHATERRFGLQQTWQSSTYRCRPPADSSTTISFHSPQPAHWKPAGNGIVNLALEQVFLVFRREDVFGLRLLSNFYQGRIERGPAAQVGEALGGERVYVVSPFRELVPVQAGS